jgi:hypothetical protein
MPPIEEMGPSREYLNRSLYAQELYDELPAEYRDVAAHYGLAKVLRHVDEADSAEELESLLCGMYGNLRVTRR